jgi:hypothetical protein
VASVTVISFLLHALHTLRLLPSSNLKFLYSSPILSTPSLVDVPLFALLLPLKIKAGLDCSLCQHPLNTMQPLAFRVSSLLQ